MLIPKNDRYKLDDKSIDCIGVTPKKIENPFITRNWQVLWLINLIWLVMIIIGVIVAAINGKIEVVTAAAFAATEQSITIILEIAGIMMLWMGILALAEKSGLMNIIGKMLKPIVRFLFPELPAQSPAVGSIVMNISANLLGLGNAATPFGLKAMEEMQRYNPDKKTASNSMITFLILNTSSLTLIPTMVIGLRVQSGSANPEEIVMLTILSTLSGTIVGLILHKILINRKQRYK